MDVTISIDELRALVNMAHLGNKALELHLSLQVASKSVSLEHTESVVAKYAGLLNKLPDYPLQPNHNIVGITDPDADLSTLSRSIADSIMYAMGSVETKLKEPGNESND